MVYCNYDMNFGLFTFSENALESKETFLELVEKKNSRLANWTDSDAHRQVAYRFSKKKVSELFCLDYHNLFCVLPNEDGWEVSSLEFDDMQNGNQFFDFKELGKRAGW